MRQSAFICAAAPACVLISVSEPGELFDRPCGGVPGVGGREFHLAELRHSGVLCSIKDIAVIKGPVCKPGIYSSLPDSGLRILGHRQVGFLKYWASFQHWRLTRSKTLIALCIFCYI